MKILLAAIAPILFSTAVIAAELEVTVNGLRNSQGLLRIAIFDQPDQFPRGDERESRDLPVRQGSMKVRFTGLAPGRYAVAIHHDENSNLEMDSNFIGLPREGYGFSRDAAVFLGPPSFNAAAVDVAEPLSKISFKVRY